MFWLSCLIFFVSNLIDVFERQNDRVMRRCGRKIKEKKGDIDLPSTGLISNACNDQCWSRLKAGAWSFILVAHMSVPPFAIAQVH